MRVLYLVSRENILEPGVLRSQVLDLAGQIGKSGVEITILNFPSLNRFFRSLGSYRGVKNHCRKLGIRLIIIPIFPIGRSIMPVWAIPIFLIQTVPWILLFRIKYHPNVIHARSYLSALAAGFLRELWIKFGFIFDIRGPYLLEGLTYSRWRRSDFNYRFWEKIERRLFTSADSVVVQSSGLEEYAKKVSPGVRVTLIPPCVDDGNFALSPRERSRGRRELGIKSNFVVVYSGSLGSFHEPEFLAQAYCTIRNFLPEPYFLVLTYSAPADLVRHLNECGVGESEFKVMKNPKDLGKLLPLGDAGLHVMSNLPITPTAIAVKFGDYTASGLPVIATGNMLSTAGLVEEHRCGVVVNLGDKKNVRSKMRQLVREREMLRKNALDLARNYFSVKICARKYLKIYDELVKEAQS